MGFKKFSLGFGLLIFPFTMGAQVSCDVRISGKVVDISTGKPLSYATLVEEYSRKGVIADEAGAFTFAGFCPGEVRIRISHIGCEPTYAQFALSGDTILALQLDHKDEHLERFEVVAETQRGSGAITRMEVRQADLEGQSGKQIAQLAELLPGMRLLQTGNAIAKPVFRGMHSNRLLLMNNGIRQEGQYWGAEHAPEIDSYIAQNLAVIEGVDALRYAADAIAGVLLVEPPDVFSHKGVEGNVQSALQSNGRGGSVAAQLAGNLAAVPNLHYRVQGSLKMLGNVRDSQNFLANTGSREWNLSYALGYSWRNWKTEIFYSNFNQRFGIYRYSHLGNLTDLYRVLEGGSQPDTAGFTYRIDRPKQHVAHELVKWRTQYTIDTGNRLEFVYARQYNGRQEYDVHTGRNPSQEALARPQLDYGLTTHLAEALYHHGSGRFTGTLGSSGMWRRNRFTGRNFMPNYTNSNYAVFWLQTLSLDAWKVSYGLRYDRYSAQVFEPVAAVDNPVGIDFDGLASSLAFKRQLEQGEVWLSLSTQWRAPAVNELFSNGLHHGAGGIEVGNPSLNPERSINATLGYKAALGRHRLHSVAYANYIRDFIFLNPSSVELTIRGAFPRFDFEQADAFFTGMDLRHETEWNKNWQTTALASFVWVRNVEQQSFFIGIPAHRFDIHLRRNFADLPRIKGLYAEVRASYTMRQYRAPELYPFEQVRNEGVAVELPQSFDFAAPPDGFFLLGFNTGFRFGKNSVGLAVENALNNAYRDYMNRFRYFADEPGINFILRFQHHF